MEHLVDEGWQLEKWTYQWRLVDGSVETTMIQVHIEVQKCDLGGGDMLSEFDGIAAIEVFKELGKGIGTKRIMEENDINET
jgi:hypothetical protein